MTSLSPPHIHTNKVTTVFTILAYNTSKVFNVPDKRPHQTALTYWCPQTASSSMMGHKQGPSAEVETVTGTESG